MEQAKEDRDVYYDFNDSERRSNARNDIHPHTHPKKPAEYVSGIDPYGQNPNTSNHLTKPIGESSFFKDSRPSNLPSQRQESDMYIDFNPSERKKSYFMQPIAAEFIQGDSQPIVVQINHIDSRDPIYDQGPRRKNDTEDLIGMDSYQLKKHSSRNAHSNLSQDRFNILEGDEPNRSVRQNTENPNLRVEMSQGYENLKFVPNKSSRMNIANLYTDNPDSFRLQSQGNQTYKNWNVDQVYGSEPKVGETVDFQFSPNSSYIKHYLENLQQQAVEPTDENHSEYHQKVKEAKLTHVQPAKSSEQKERPSKDHLSGPMRESKPKKFDSAHPNDDNNNFKCIPMYSSVPENQPTHSHINKIPNPVQNDTMNSVLVNQLASQYITILEESALNLADYAHISKARMHNNKQLDETLGNHTYDNRSSEYSLYEEHHSDHILVYENTDEVFNNDDLPKVFVKQYISNSIHQNVHNKESPGIFFQKKIASSNFQQEFNESAQNENDSANLIRFSEFAKNRNEGFDSNASRNIEVVGLSQGLSKVRKSRLNDESERKISPLISPAQVNESVDNVPEVPARLQDAGQGFERKIGFGNFVLSKELIIERKKKARELHPEHQAHFGGSDNQGGPIQRDDELRKKITESLKLVNKESIGSVEEFGGQKKHQTDTSFNRISLNDYKFPIPNDIIVESIRRESLNASKRNSIDQTAKPPQNLPNNPKGYQANEVILDVKTSANATNLNERIKTETEVSFKFSPASNKKQAFVKQSNPQIAEEQLVHIKGKLTNKSQRTNNQSQHLDLPNQTPKAKGKLQTPSTPNLQVLEVAPMGSREKQPVISEPKIKSSSRSVTPNSKAKTKEASQTQPITTNKQVNVSRTQPLSKSPVRSRPKLHEPKQTSQAYVPPITNISRSTSPVSKSPNKSNTQKINQIKNDNKPQNASTHQLIKPKTQVTVSTSPIKKSSPSPSKVQKTNIRSPSPNRQKVIASNNNPFFDNTPKARKVNNEAPPKSPKRSASPISKTGSLSKSVQQNPQINSQSPTKSRSKSPNLVQTQPLSQRKPNHTIIMKGQKDYKRERDLALTTDHPLSKLAKEKNKLLEMREKVARLKHQINSKAKEKAIREAQRLVPDSIDHYKDFVR
jgi:hypothetical protein